MQVIRCNGSDIEIIFFIEKKNEDIILHIKYSVPIINYKQNED